MDDLTPLLKASRRLVNYHVKSLSPGLSAHDIEDFLGDIHLKVVVEWAREFDPSRGNSIETFLGKKIYYACLQMISETLGLTDDGRKVYSLVKKKSSELSSSSNSDFHTLPLEKIEDACVGELTTPAYVEWSLRRKKKAIKGVVLALRGLEGEISLQAGGSDRGDSVLNEERVLEPHLVQEQDLSFEIWDEIFGKLSNKEKAQKLGVLMIFREEIFNAQPKKEWLEIAEWLSIPHGGKTEPPPCDWAGICETGNLTAYLPSQWKEVRRLFQNPPPNLTPGSIRQWYRRCRQVFREAV
jgi:hypothetical protein